MKRDITDAIRFSDEESKDFSSVLNITINELCRYADEHDFNRDSFIIHVAEQLSLFGRMNIAESFKVDESSRKDGLGEWLDNSGFDPYCSECGEPAIAYESMTHEMYYRNSYCHNCGVKMKNARV